VQPLLVISYTLQGETAQRECSYWIESSRNHWKYFKI